ncbi:MAG TPA: universal stress protein [Cyclobacteriaceae bacterium]|nr:universal stress protein [Cyclobacteriaceae bacterium]
MNRLLLCLDGSETDRAVLRYTSFLCDYIKPEKIYFLHIARSLDLPNDIKEKYPDLLAPVDESISRVLQESIKAHFTYDGCEKEIEVREGNPTERILKYSRQKDIDLMIFGKKQKDGDGVLPGKLARLANASLLFITEHTAIQLKRIFTPIDFSSACVMPFRIAQALAANSKAKVTAQHTYVVPSGYHKTGKSFDEFAEIMKGHAQRDFANFIRQNQFEEVDCIFSLDQEDSAAKAIYNAANEVAPDLIIMGSKGRKGAAGWILGSVADKMTRIHYPYNLLIIKDRKENLSFLDALMKV